MPSDSTAVSSVNPGCNAFFQFPKRFWKEPEESVWFENRCLGANKLGSKMKELSKAANLSQVYTNHCIRATAITLWSDAGLSNRHIMTLSGHRNENSLKSYNARPSSQQLQVCSNVLSCICPKSTSHTSRLANASLPIWNRCLCYGSKPAKLHKIR